MMNGVRIYSWRIEPDSNKEVNVMSYIYTFLGWIIDWCYRICHNYALAIVLFTLISKIVLLPVSLWTYYNSIKMMRIQPDINYLKVKYYGQKDQIAEEQAKLFKQEGYHPLISTIPTIIQLILLMGVVGVIRLGIENPAIDMNLGFVSLDMVPNQEGIRLMWVPLLAGVSSWGLCLAQNASNVLQSEQSKLNKYGTTILSVGLSLYLGWFVFVGTAFYWVCSNLMAVLQLYILNAIIRPKRFVDYGRLEDSRRQLEELQEIGRHKDGYFSENKKRERADYKRFFSVVNKHLVFYSESNGFYKYFRGFIEYILKHTNITIHYITSDPDDQIFRLEKDEPRIRGYYIGENKLITLMMKMDADVVVMTMPDLENYHIKRSYIRDDIEYIFVQHGMGSNNMGMRRGCTDHFDTIFCAGIHQREEEEQIGAYYHLPERTLVELGYPLIDEMRAEYNHTDHPEHKNKKILIAPSWQKDNIIDSCLETILDELKGRGYEVIVRPHPQEVRLKKEYMEALKKKYEASGIDIQTDFSSNNPVLEADLLITDWSGISWEYAFTTLKPILYINTPMKIMNPDYQNIEAVPLNIVMRDKLGLSIDLDKLNTVPDQVEYLLTHKDEYHDQIDRLAHEFIYNLDHSAEIGAEYIIHAIQEKIARKGDNIS